MPISQSHHQYRGHIKSHEKAHISDELCQEIDCSAHSSLKTEHVPSMTLIVIYLLEEEYPRDAKEYKVFKGLIDHVNRLHANCCLFSDYKIK